MQVSNPFSKPSGKSATAVVGLLSLLIAGAGVSLALVLTGAGQDKAEPPPVKDTAEAELITPPATANEPEPVIAKPPAEENRRPPIDVAALNAVLQEATSAQVGKLSVVVSNLKTGETLASLNPQNTYFTASLYKLYMALLAYQDIDAGELNGGQPLVQHSQYGPLDLNACLYLMVQISDSVCGEAVLNLYDYGEAQIRLRQLGLPHINMPAFSMSASDAANLLALIYTGEDLRPASHARLLDSLRYQYYSHVLRAAFKARDNVYNKVGYSESVWHDIGFVEFSERDAVLAIVILSEDLKPALVTNLARQIEQTIPADN